MPPMMPRTDRKRSTNAADIADANETWVSVGDGLWEKVGNREQAAIERKRRRLTRNIIPDNPTTNTVVIDLTEDNFNSNQLQPANALPVPNDGYETDYLLEAIINSHSPKVAQCNVQAAEIAPCTNEFFASSEIKSLEEVPSTSKDPVSENFPDNIQPRENKSQESNNACAYLELKKLQQSTLIPNVEEFECEICMVEYGASEGVVLHECIHTFCRECLAETIRQCADPQVPCPSSNCDSVLQDREVRALVPEHDYERWLARGLSIAEGSSRGSFHCRFQDCIGWAICEPEVARFPCPVCERVNCIPCQAIHESETCEEYRAKLKEAANGNASQLLIESLISRGEAMLCPECKVVITKAIGCDWLQCTGCKTEICWITKGRRWGPRGRGDTSGGCRCGVKRKKCHPKCGNCH